MRLVEHQVHPKRIWFSAIENLPACQLLETDVYHWFCKMEGVMPLNFLDYDKDEAKEIISKELGWKDYGGKHFESIITRFYQGYILPTKFGIDKRKAHFSTLIASGQMTRKEAIELLKEPPYSLELLNEDRKFVQKKFGLSGKEFDEIMAKPVKPHDAYPSYLTKHYLYHERIMRFLSPLTSFVKNMLGKKTENKAY